MIATATGVRPLVAGKPEPPLHHESVLRTGAERPLVVGDRLDTDIEGAQRVGSDSLLVLTGVTGPAEAILAPPSQRPHLPGRGSGRAARTAPEVTSQDGTYRCGGWTARQDGNRLELAGPRGPRNGGDRIDGLRASCAAAWAGDGVSPEAARAAAQRLDGAR